MTLEPHFQQDLADVAEIPIITSILDVICTTTGMRFSAVARVTENRWIACSVDDRINFGLKPGAELEVKTTICDEIRGSGKPVIIDHVSKDPHFRTHHTPKMYGLESYISIPIYKKDGSFFGTLCAIDPEPHKINTPEIVEMFHLFADLISFHLQTVELLRTSNQALIEERALHQLNEDQNRMFTQELQRQVIIRTEQLREKNDELDRANKELQSFIHISSHDLQEPLRKIQTLASAISEKDAVALSPSSKTYFDRLQQAAAQMQSLISDLFSYSQTSVNAPKFEAIDLTLITDEVKELLRVEIEDGLATIEVGEMPVVPVLRSQFRQAIQNLVNNALKFTYIDRKPHIKIEATVAPGSEFDIEGVKPGVKYCRLVISDNGIGFDTRFNDRIFELFQRLHTRKVYDGTGMGLAIVKKIIDNHNGIITADSVLNEGTKFTIYLPVLEER